MSLIKRRGDAAEESLLDRYRAELRLDRNALESAAEDQPHLFLEVAEQHVQAASRCDAARDELTRTDARLGRAVRAEMEAKGMKPTEGRVADEVLGHQDHLDAAARLATARVEVDNWAALRVAFDHRLRMIRELVALYGAGYYTAGGAGAARSSTRDTHAAAGREALARARADRRP